MARTLAQMPDCPLKPHQVRRLSGHTGLSERTIRSAYSGTRRTHPATMAVLARAAEELGYPVPMVGDVRKCS